MEELLDPALAAAEASDARPLARRRDALDSTRPALLVPDATRLPCGDEQLCVEIKPKSGLWPSRGQPACKFCMHTSLRYGSETGERAAEAPAYCPLRLYPRLDESVRRLEQLAVASPPAPERAIADLLRTPSNNLRIFSADGSVVYGQGTPHAACGTSGQTGALVRALQPLAPLLLASMSRERDSSAAPSATPAVESDSLPQALSFAISAILSAALTAGGGLQRLVALQAAGECRDGAAGAWRAYTRGVRLAGLQPRGSCGGCSSGWKQQLQQQQCPPCAACQAAYAELAPQLEYRLAEALQHAQGAPQRTVEDDGKSDDSKDEIEPGDAGSDGGGGGGSGGGAAATGSRAESRALARCARTLRAFLLSASAKDASLMLAMRVEEMHEEGVLGAGARAGVGAEATTLRSAGASSQPLAEGAYSRPESEAAPARCIVIELPGAADASPRRLALTCITRVVDCDPKPLARVPHYAALEAACRAAHAVHGRAVATAAARACAAEEAEWESV